MHMRRVEKVVFGLPLLEVSRTENRGTQLNLIKALNVQIELKKE